MRLVVKDAETNHLDFEALTASKVVSYVRWFRIFPTFEHPIPHNFCHYESIKKVCLCVCEKRVREWVGKRNAGKEPSDNEEDKQQTLAFVAFVQCTNTPLRSFQCLTDRRGRTWCIVCVCFAFHHKLDIREFAFQLALVRLRIAHGVNVRFLYLDVAHIDDFSNQYNSRIMAHLV